jgi:predicted nucleic acid-binding protein
VLVYLDSALIIYLVEQNPVHAPAVEAWLTANPLATIVSNELARMECLVVPVRNADAARVADFDAFFSGPVSRMIALDRVVFNKTIQVRAAYPSFRTPDAIHLAAAETSGCRQFLTNDAKLGRYAGITVTLI